MDVITLASLAALAIKIVSVLKALVERPEAGLLGERRDHGRLDESRVGDVVVCGGRDLVRHGGVLLSASTDRDLHESHLLPETVLELDGTHLRGVRPLIGRRELVELLVGTNGLLCRRGSTGRDGLSVGGRGVRSGRSSVGHGVRG